MQNGETEGVWVLNNIGKMADQFWYGLYLSFLLSKQETFFLLKLQLEEGFYLQQKKMHFMQYIIFFSLK